MAQTNARPLSVLAIHRYYWPDAPPYASMLRAIVAHWRSVGYEPEVFSSQPSYKPRANIPRRPRLETVDGSPVRRIALPREHRRAIKALNLVMFTVATFFHVVRRRRDVVMCSTSPPVILGAAVSLAARLRRSAFIYHCMDLHPEIGALSGEFSNRFVYRVLERLDRGTCRRAAAIVVLSGDMKDSLIRRDPSIADRIVILNNFDLPDFADHVEAAEAIPAGSPGAFRLVFTGNIGRFQGLESVVEGVAALRDELDVELIFMGEGGARADLERLAADLPAIRFLEHGTPTAARALMRSADLGLVTLTPQIIRYAYPSKTMTYLSEGLPLLVAVEPDSALARTVVEEGIGFAVPPLDAAAVSATIRVAVAQRSALQDMKHAARDYARTHFGQEQALARWATILAETVDEVEPE